MRVLVTGAAGYIGAMLVPELLELGCEVVAIDLFPQGTAPLAALFNNPKLTCIRRDVTSPPIEDRFDVIIPLAGLVGAPLCELRPREALEVNCRAVCHLRTTDLDARFILPTTNSGYGVGGEALCTEESPLNPVSVYGKTKMDAEKYVLQTGGVSLRLATVFGQSPSFRRDLLVNDFTYRAVKDKAVVLFEAHHRRNFIHIRDVVQAFVHAITHYDKMKGQAFNVGLSHANLTKRELCERIKKQVPGFAILEAPIGRDPDQRDYVVSNKKMEATGWKPKHSLDDGIAELIRSFA